ncbi:MAG: 1-deoxy-D-xylulose-5-phosphate synthase [Casimicrobiaceae bacterium]|nr:1-deoxy-D-xylulose-5-phosphate synthase [Casimicrobiaceae bacterium]
MSLLERIDSPEDLRRLAPEELPALCDELRHFVTESVAKTGGHFASNLGVIELTVALHYCLNTPHDRLIWDVGHQCYPHKILTGRRKRMHTLRQWGGLAGFPRREESEYDTFGTAHSSTSISAALGMAVAAKAKGEKRRVVAVIGDGAMSAGMAFEALNNAGAMDADLLVILNDNEMSISEPVGALNRYLSRVLASHSYERVRAVGKRVLSVAPSVARFARRAEEHVKGMVLPGTLWEEFGFNYIGPIDGHDVQLLVDTLDKIKDRPGPQFLHVITKKGAGYKLAEEDPILYHGVGKFDHAVGIPAGSGKATKKTYSEVFGDWLCEAAAADARVVGITPAMREGSGMVRFSQEFPERYFDVGIAEQHAVTFAAGLACEGMKPVVAIYSTFLQRAYDQAIHDVALQNLPVVFAIDRAGLVGADGPTHAGSFDVAYLRCVPNMVLMVPATAAECRAMLSFALTLAGPVAVRYPRGAAHGPEDAAVAPLELGRGLILRPASAKARPRVALLAWGSMLHPCATVAESLDATLANMRFAKPLDVPLVCELARTHDLLVTVEEASVMGSAGSAVLEALAAAGLSTPVLTLGLPDRFIDQGDPAIMLASVGLDAPGIERSVRERLAQLAA